MHVRLDNPADPALAPYISLRERDLVKGSQFVAEGEVVVRVLVNDSPMRVVSMLVEERRVDALEDVIARLPADVPVLVVPQSVMDRVVGFAIHRGVLALGERGPSTLDFTTATSVLGLIGLTNHDNVGGVFRNAAAFGAQVLLDEATCDPLYRKAIRVSAGAALFVPFARFPSAESVMDAMTTAGFEPIALTPSGEEAIDALPRGRYGLLLGTEGPGLPDEVMRRARRVRIRMRPGFDSLNVAVASGIALHRLADS
jgi:tRNA G18 (ribose-2'-O)-methylase SpoU